MRSRPIPSPDLLRILWDEGVTHYDVASIGEVRLVARDAARGATLCFMHPVKAEEAIAEAYFEHGVRTFSLDTLEELDKIVARHRDRRRRRDRPQPAGPPAGQLGPCQAQPRRQVRRRAARGEGAAVRRPPGVRRARHLLPRRQPGDEPGGLCRSDGAGPRRDRRGRGDGRHRRCRRRLPVVLSGHGAARRSRPISRSSTTPSRRCRSATRPNCGASRAAPCAPNMPASWSASKSAAATSCTSTTAPMARCSMPRTSAGAIRCGCSATSRRTCGRHGVQLLRPDLRRSRPYGRPVRAARRRRRRRLYRDRHARRLWLRDAHRLQRLRRRRAPRSSTTSRWPASTEPPREPMRSNVVKL